MWFLDPLQGPSPFGLMILIGVVVLILLDEVGKKLKR